MSRLLVDDVTKTDARALLNVNKMATISDIVAPSNEYIYASGANELTVVEGCVIAVGGAGIFKTANTILTAANLDAGSAFAVGKDYYVYICDSRIDSADEKYVISLNSTYPTGWNATNSRKIGGKVVSAMVGMIKPDAGIYQCLFDKYNLNPKECVFIDDRPENIEGGRKLGMEGIVFTDYETGKKKLEQILMAKSKED